MNHKKIQINQRTWVYTILLVTHWWPHICEMCYYIISVITIPMQLFEFISLKRPEVFLKFYQFCILVARILDFSEAGPHPNKRGSPVSRSQKRMDSLPGQIGWLHKYITSACPNPSSSFHSIDKHRLPCTTQVVKKLNITTVVLISKLFTCIQTRVTSIQTCVTFI